TRSLIPLLAMSGLLSAFATNRSRFPEIVVHAVRGERTAERHLHAIADLDRGRIDVGQFALKTSSALEVDDRRHDRGRERVGETIRRVRGNGGGDICHRLRGHAVHRLALDADTLRRQMTSATALAAASREPELPRFAAKRWRRRRAFRIRT